jgi:hypothetical protein
MVEPLANAHPVDMKSAITPRALHQDAGRGQVLINEDELRALLLRRWHGSRRELIERDEEVVREALAAHTIFEQARPVEARIFHGARCG